MAANEDEVRLRLTAETVAWQSAWAQVRVQTARDLAQIKTTVVSNLGQARVSAAQNLAGIKQTAAANLGQMRVNTAQQLAQIRLNTAQQLSQIRNNATRTLGQMGSQFESAGQRMSVGLTLPLVALAAAAVRSAKAIDTQLNVLRAFAGGSEAAEKRLAQLNATALKTPGLTADLAVTLDAQLRPLKVAEQTIDRILPALGRLNAISPLGDPQKFARNLTQIVTQNFERTDLKELVGQSPYAGKLITEIFNVDSPINSTAIRKAAQRMGIRTVDDFLTAFAAAAARDSGLQNAGESIATRFEKLFGRMQLALRPLGLAIVDALTPIVERGAPIVEALGRAFSALPGPLKTAAVLVGGFAAAVGPALFITGSLINTVGSLQKAYVALNALALIPTISNLRLLGQIMQGTSGLAAGAAATAAVKIGAWAAVIAAAVAASLALARATDGWLASLSKAHPKLANFGLSVLVSIAPLYGLLRQLGLIGPETEKVADAQSQAVPAIDDFSEAVEEEVESLKHLRRALAEVEIATKSRVAAARRAYNEDRTTAAQFAGERIQALRDEQAAHLRVIDEGLEARRKRREELEQASKGPISPEGLKELKTTKEEIEKLELDRTKLAKETATEIADIESDLRKKQRENEERHRESLLAVRRTEAEEKIAALRDAAERDEALRLENEKVIVKIERDITDAEIKEIQRRVDAAAQGTEARASLEDELAQKRAVRARQGAEQDRRIREAELADALRLIRRRTEADQAAEEAAQGQIARLRDAAERGRRARALLSVPAVERDPQTGKLREVRRLAEIEVRTHADAERAIKDIIDRGFRARAERLNEEIEARRRHNENVEKLVEDRKRLEQEQANAAEEADRRIRDAAERDEDTQFERSQRRVAVLQTLAEAEIAVREAVLKTVRRTFGVEKDLINERYDSENERVTLAGNRAQEELDRRERDELAFWRKSVATEEEYQRKKLEVQEDYDALRKAEADRTAFEIEALERERERELDRFAPIKDAWDDFKDHVSNASDSIRESVASMAGSIRDAFGTLENGIRQGIISWLLYGESLGKALKRALAESLAAVAADAAIQALKHAAYAIGSWAFGDARGALMHAKAAAAFGALAIAAGVGARVAANAAGLNRNSSAASAAVGGVGGGGESQPNNKTFTYGVGSTPASDEGGGGARGRGLVGGPLAEVLNRVDAHMEEQRKVTAMQMAFNARVASHIESLGVTSEAQIVTIGAPDAPEAVGVALMTESGRNAELNDVLARNMRVQ